jgi:hypothetical protein
MNELKLGLLLTLAMGCSAQHNYTPSPPPREAREASLRAGLCRIEGLVLKADSVSPLPGATVKLRSQQAGLEPESEYTFETGQGGRFFLEDVPPGRYELIVERAGYAAGYYGQRSRRHQGTPLTLRPGEELKDLILRVPAGAVITGRVWDPYGEPAAGVAVEALRYQWKDEEARLLPVATERTNDRGEYRLYGLAPGRYWVAAGRGAGASSVPAPVHAMGAGPHQVAPVTYYPGTVDAARGLRVVIAADEEVAGVDIQVQTVPVYSVRGTVLGWEGQAAGLALYLSAVGDTEELSEVRSAWSEDGQFEIKNVPPGSYILQSANHVGHSAYARQRVTVTSGDVEGLVLKLLPRATVRGRVQVLGHGLQLPEGTTVQLCGGDSPGCYEETLGSDNRFVFSARAGRYHLEVAGTGHELYLKEVRLGGRDVLSGFEVVNGGSHGALELVIAPGAGMVDGRVLSEEELPAHGARVLLAPQKQERDLWAYRETVADQNGMFSFSGLRPGDYWLYAWEDLDEGEWREPGFLPQFERQRVAVRVEEYGRPRAELRAVPAGTAR